MNNQQKIIKRYLARMKRSSAFRYDYGLLRCVMYGYIECMKDHGLDKKSELEIKKYVLKELSDDKAA